VRQFVSAVSHVRDKPERYSWKNHSAFPKCLIGTHIQWHNDEFDVVNGFCESCYNKPMGDGEYCLKCSRNWNDEHIYNLMNVEKHLRINTREAKLPVITHGVRRSTSDKERGLKTDSSAQKVA
jgi:hypothetical protein